jgi:hypothetical protein
MNTPTPGPNNVAPNTPPTLETISDVVLTLGRSLSLIVTATDADLPPQTLTFSLGPGAPAGAAIDPVTGVLSWTPGVAGANAISVIVSDNGSPSMSATRTFMVRVALPPGLGQAGFSSGEQFTFGWPTTPGQGYQVEYTEDLSANSWVPVGDPLTGTGEPIAFYSDLNTSAQGYFRVRILGPGN